MYNCHNPDRKGSGQEKRGRKDEKKRANKWSWLAAVEQRGLLSPWVVGEPNSPLCMGVCVCACVSVLVYVHTHQVQGGKFQEGGVIRREATGAGTTYFSPRNQDTERGKTVLARNSHTHICEEKGKI